MTWFQLKPGGNPLAGSDYNPGTTAPPSNCPETGFICAISTGASPDNPDQPDLNQSIRDAMLVALQTGTESGNVLLRNTP